MIDEATAAISDRVYQQIEGLRVGRGKQKHGFGVSRQSRPVLARRILGSLGLRWLHGTGNSSTIGFESWELVA